MKAHRRLVLVVALIASTLAGVVRTGHAQAQAPAVRMIPVEGEGARYWPRWRGPSGQGLVASSGYPDRWSATDNVIWRTSVAGRGNSSPVVWGDHIFLTTGRDRGRRLYVLAYRRSDGALPSLRR